MNHTNSFDEKINDISYTFAPVSNDDEQCVQYSVLSDQWVFRMTLNTSKNMYEIDNDGEVPDEIRALESQLSNVILKNEHHDIPSS